MAPCSYSAPSCGRLHPGWWWAVGELPANDGHCGPVVLSKDLRRWCHIHKVVDQWPPPGVLPALPNYECHPKNAFYATYASPHGSVSWTSTLLVPACCVKLFLFPRFGPLVRHWTMRFEAINTRTLSSLHRQWEILSTCPTHWPWGTSIYAAIRPTMWWEYLGMDWLLDQVLFSNYQDLK